MLFQVPVIVYSFVPHLHPTHAFDVNELGPPYPFGAPSKISYFLSIKIKLLIPIL